MWSVFHCRTNDVAASVHRVARQTPSVQEKDRPNATLLGWALLIGALAGTWSLVARADDECEESTTRIRSIVSGMSKHAPVQSGGTFGVAVIEKEYTTIPSRWQITYTEPHGRTLRFDLRGLTGPAHDAMDVGAEKNQKRYLIITYQMGAAGRLLCEYAIAPSQGKFMARKMK
jgi:hypothetical protein